MDSQESHPGRPTKPSPIREVVVILGGGCLLLALFWLGSQLLAPRIRVLDRATGGRLPDGPYAGSRVCAECHPGEYAAFTGSGHARTLQPAADSKLAGRLVGRTIADPEHPGVTWTYGLDRGRFFADRAEGGHEAVERFLLEYAVGSGHHSLSFLTLTDPRKPTSLEHRLTYFAQSGTVEVTPGHLASDRMDGVTPYGRNLPERTTQRCFGCHTTPTGNDPPTAPGMDPLAGLEPLTPYVSCERCHGTARGHVEEARRGKQEMSVPFGQGQWTADAQMGLCGQCHRHPRIFPAEMIRPDDPGLARFQPVGLMQSKCYTRSDGGLSCVTCHDPHARASTNRTAYEAACLSCHGPSTPRGTGCPVDSRQGCIDCHMPRVDPGQHVRWTDHWIRVRRDAGVPAASPETGRD